MDWVYPHIAASLAEDRREEIIEYIPTLVKYLQQSEGQPRRDAARALAAVATCHPETEIYWIHDLIQQLGPEDRAVNRHLIRAIRGLMHSDSISQTPPPTRRTATYSMWRSDAFDLVDETDPTEPNDRPNPWRSDIFSIIPETDTRVRIHDRVMERQIIVDSSQEIEKEEVDLDEFDYPVDFGFKFHTDQLRLPTANEVFVRDQDNSIISDYRTISDGPVSFQADTYTVEIPGPFKSYLQFERKVEFQPPEEKGGVKLHWPTNTEIKIGFRSHHEQPSGTITTSSDPREMMIALSRLGSALKTTSSERSYPTLRAHPPIIELGEQLSIPPNIGSTETGVVVEVPEEYQYIFTVAPLAYYLGARIVPGETAQIVTKSGFIHPLGNCYEEFEEEVARVLKQSFVFDCLVRTEGFYKVELAERNSVEALLDVDLQNLYGTPLYERLEVALETPFEYFEPHMPTWRADTTVVPEPESVEALPFLVTDMSTIRTRSVSEVSITSQQTTGAVGELFRGEYDGEVKPHSEHPKGTENECSSREARTTQIEVPETSQDVINRRWVGDGVPVNASKAIVEGFRNDISTPNIDSQLRVAVVVNDSGMREESSVMDIYREEAVLPVNIDFHMDLTKADLRDLLSEEIDLLHYIGHVTEDGIRCVDGALDVSSVDNIQVRTFILNACHSHHQGSRLVEGGAAGGIVTIGDVVNSIALKMGRRLAGLLNRGFTLANAVKVAKQSSPHRRQYIVLGNGGITLSQSDNGLPLVYSVAETDTDSLSVSTTAYPSGQFKLGTIMRGYWRDNNVHQLALGDLGQTELTMEEFRQYVDLDSPTVQWE